MATEQVGVQFSQCTNIAFVYSYIVVSAFSGSSKTNTSYIFFIC